MTGKLHAGAAAIGTSDRIHLLRQKSLPTSLWPRMYDPPTSMLVLSAIS